MTEFPIKMLDLNLFLYVVLGFYVGVFASDKMKLKFKTVVYPFVLIAEWIGSLIKKSNEKDDNEEEKIKGKV